MSAWAMRAGWQGILVGGAITGVQHLEAGWGIKAGECLSAGEDIRAGEGYGVFAGLNVQVDTWDASAAGRVLGMG